MYGLTIEFLTWVKLLASSISEDYFWSDHLSKNSVILFKFGMNLERIFSGETYLHIEKHF